jgi:hypothetical protein
VPIKFIIDEGYECSDPLKPVKSADLEIFKVSGPNVNELEYPLKTILCTVSLMSSVQATELLNITLSAEPGTIPLLQFALLLHLPGFIQVIVEENESTHITHKIIKIDIK